MVWRLFLTPAALPTENAKRLIDCPNSSEWFGLLNRALLLLSDAAQYEQVNDTDLTPEDVAAWWYAAYERYLTERYTPEGNGMMSVQARYNAGTGQSNPTSTPVVVQFSTRDYDTHNAVTTGASWRFTAPQAGWYHVDMLLGVLVASWAAGNAMAATLRKNGTAFCTLDSTPNALTVGSVSYLHGHAALYLEVDDYIDVEFSHTMVSNTQFAQSAVNRWISIAQVG